MMNVSFILGLVFILVCGFDLLYFFIYAFLHLPTGLTEGLCYPFWHIIRKGFGMKISMIIRLVEIVGLIVGILLIA